MEVVVVPKLSMQHAMANKILL